MWSHSISLCAGFNTECTGDNRARFGFCGNYASQACQAGDAEDADFAIGIGCHGQFDPKAWGAGTDEESYNGATGGGPKQAWVYAVHSSDPAQEVTVSTFIV